MTNTFTFKMKLIKDFMCQTLGYEFAVKRFPERYLSWKIILSLTPEVLQITALFLRCSVTLKLLSTK